MPGMDLGEEIVSFVGPRPGRDDHDRDPPSGDPAEPHAVLPAPPVQTHPEPIGMRDPGRVVHPPDQRGYGEDDADDPERSQVTHARSIAPVAARNHPSIPCAHGGRDAVPIARVAPGATGFTNTAGT